METEVLLDAGAVSRCRRRVHLEADPSMRGTRLAPPDPAAEQRIADAATHRMEIRRRLVEAIPGAWVTVPRELPADERARITEQALADGAGYIWGALLPADRHGHRRGGAELLVRAEGGYLPLLVVRHRITDPGTGAVTTAPTDLDPAHALVDEQRKVRSQARDQLRLAHLRRMLETLGLAAQRPLGGVIGLDADVVLWHDLAAPTWPGGRSALAEYDSRFADRVAVARAAATGGPALAEPSRILECRTCPWWPTCEAELRAVRDVSLVVRGEDAVELRRAGVSTVDKLAALDPADEPPIVWTSGTFADAVALARAWLADLTVVRRVREVAVPRGDVEVDVDMESFGESGAYLWGCLLSGADIGMTQGYRSFVTWDPLPTVDEARSFAQFWAWLCEVRARTAAAGLTFRAYCYNAMAENRWLFGSVERFGGLDGIPGKGEVQSFVDSDEWVDLFRGVSDQFLCARGKGLKVVAPVAGFSWRDPEASGEASMRWYRDAVGMDGAEPDAGQRERLLRYNEDDVRATRVLRAWMSGPANEIPYMGDL
ncbi:TM0106 family RecB-like putative nuclease [Amycolatopsis acidiphila]|uniref:TM0106 family RecB-like putative nuclease n=1 Tax=Amycolatopsis acidiphila TaxID=715473 RepID=A0A558AFS9_9PSEU|nr:TM0106 family RecB-like putative nuclease [Amycolatopsis acidiphila]TVT23121.1 TM0106 family RecB-like putative nuclease [Amycolatopsis acidiphila]UIJ60193.1 TM0106 family RecB-like putative nuclease [Amycolatopsis acidiphila]